MRRGHSTVLAAAAACGVTLLIGGIAWAAIPGDGGIINACYGKVGGVVRVIDTAKREKCITGVENPISWNQQGAPGTPGAPGAPGVSPTVAQLASGDPHCAAGGAAITDAAGSIAYVCSGSNGRDGEAFSGTFTSPNGLYSMTVTDDGIALSSAGHQILHISGLSVNVTADNIGIDATQNASVTAGSTTSITSGADTTFSTGGNLTADVANDTSINSGGSTALQTSGLDIDSAGPVSVSSANNLSLHTGQTMAVSSSAGIAISAGGSFAVQSASDMTLLSGHNTDIEAVNTMTIRGATVSIN